MDTPSAPAGGDSQPSSSTPAPTSSPTSSLPGVSAATANPAPAKAQTSAPVKPTPPGTRAPNGQFLPKEGTQGVSPDHRETATTNADGTPKTPEEKQAWRLKTKIKVYGQEEEIDLDEEGVTREVQQHRALRKQFGPLTETAKKGQALIDLATKDPAAFLAAAGHDTKKVAAQLLAAQAKLETMTPEQRRIHELETALSAREQQDAEDAERAAAEEKAAKVKEVTERTEKRYMGLLEKSGMERTHESLYYLAETDGLLQKKGIQLNDDQLISETKRRLGGIAKAHYSSMPVEQLETELGPEKIKALLQLQVARFEKAHAFAPAPVAQTSAPEAPAAPAVLSEAEIDRRLRAMANEG